VPLLANSKREQLHMEDSALAEWVASQLVRAGAAKVENDLLLDC
jgi:hypothetical protein